MGGTHYFAPQFRSGIPSQSFTIHQSVRPPAPHRPWPPHLPPPTVPGDDGPGLSEDTAPAYSSTSPPPAYSLVSRYGTKRSLDLDVEDQPLVIVDDGQTRPDEQDEEAGGGPTTAVVVLLVVLNVVVWTAVVWNVIQEGQASKLWADLQQSDRVMFDV